MKKILNSKWTASLPKNKEKHFMVIKIYKNEIDPQILDSIVIQAVMTKKEYQIDPAELKTSKWLVGWV